MLFLLKSALRHLMHENLEANNNSCESQLGKPTQIYESHHYFALYRPLIFNFLLVFIASRRGSGIRTQGLLIVRAIHYHCASTL